MRKPESLQPGITESQNVSFGPSLPHSSFQDVLQTSICTVLTSTAVVSGNPGSFLPVAGPLQFPFTSCPKTVPAETPAQQLCPLYLLLGFLLPAERSCVGMGVCFATATLTLQVGSASPTNEFISLEMRACCTHPDFSTST